MGVTFLIFLFTFLIIMDRQIVNKIYLKLRAFLAENGYINGVSFDVRTYDNEEDIPHITHNGERRKVSFFSARGKETIFVVLSPYWHEVVNNINYMDTDELLNLLRDVYYELNESYEIGDFDEVFCKGLL